MLAKRRIVFLGSAALLSVATVYLTQQWLQGQLTQVAETARSEAAPAASARVLVAGKALPAGAILQAGDLRWQAWPADASTAGYLTSASTNPDQLTGSVVRADLVAGEPITTERVVKAGDRGLMAAVLRPGYRAMTINVSASTGVGGFLFPGDHVDLILSRSVGSADSQRHVSETVLTDVRVVGVDQRASNAKNEIIVPSTATIEVTPKQAEVVAVVSELGKLSLALRSLAAAPTAPIAPHNVTRTWDIEAVQAAAPRAAAPRTERAATARPAASPAVVTVVRGGQVDTTGAAR